MFQPTALPAPRQARSRATLERILTAAETLLEQQLFDEFSMAVLAREAGVSVGTIYTRFPAKEALLPVLFTRHNQALGPRLLRLESDLCAEPGLRARSERLVRFALDYYQRWRGLLRALSMYVQANPTSIGEALFRERAELYRGIAAALLGDGREVRVRDPLETANFLLGAVDAILRQQLLFGDTNVFRGRRPRAELERRLIDLVRLGLAGSPDSQPAPRRRNTP